MNFEVVSFSIDYQKILSAPHAKPYMNRFGNGLPSTQNNNFENQFISIVIIVNISTIMPSYDTRGGTSCRFFVICGKKYMHCQDRGTS